MTVQKILIENERNKRFVNFTLCTILSCLTKILCCVTPSCSRCESSLFPEYPPCLCCLPVSPLTAIPMMRAAVSVSKNSNAGGSDTLKRRCKALPLNEKVKVLNSDKKKKLSNELAAIYGENEWSIHETVKNDKEICASFAVVSQTAELLYSV